MDTYHMLLLGCWG